MGRHKTFYDTIDMLYMKKKKSVDKRSIIYRNWVLKQ